MQSVKTWRVSISNFKVRANPGRYDMHSECVQRYINVILRITNRPHRLVVRTSRRGRDNPGSTPGVDIFWSEDGMLGINVCWSELQTPISLDLIDLGRRMPILHNRFAVNGLSRSGRPFAPAFWIRSRSNYWSSQHSLAARFRGMIFASGARQVQIYTKNRFWNRKQIIMQGILAHLPVSKNSFQRTTKSEIKNDAPGTGSSTSKNSKGIWSNVIQPMVCELVSESDRPT